MVAKITDAELNKLSTDFKIPFRNMKSVMAIESQGAGFFNDGSPKILFEPKWFNELTKGKYITSHPNITRKAYDPAYYKAFPDARKNFAAASALDPNAAMQATSWGLGQIMGMNYKKAGFNKVEDMVAAFKKSEYEQAKGMFNFIKSDAAMMKALLDKDWTTFAKRYNGPAYESNKYDLKLKAAFENAKDFAGSTGGQITIAASLFFLIVGVALLIYLSKRSGAQGGIMIHAA